MDSLNTAVPPAPTFRQPGFTLTEMAVVLVIVALLIGGMLVPMSAQQDMRQIAATEKLLADAGEALYGFAAGHAASDGKPYLPCPDTNGDGVEDRSGNACTNQEGNLPWTDLGLGRQDAWGNPVRYAVAAAFSNSATGFTLLASGDRRVCAESACTTVLASAVPAVILSRGKNGGVAPTDADEQENTDADNDYVQRTVTTTFDDVVTWLPPGILTNRMIAAGRLP